MNVKQKEDAKESTYLAFLRVLNTLALKFP
jgi:hypothetical protein